TRSMPSAAEISPRRAAWYSAESACERTSVGATSWCSAATSISPAATRSSVSQSTTNRVTPRRYTLAKNASCVADGSSPRRRSNIIGAGGAVVTWASEWAGRTAVRAARHHRATQWPRVRSLAVRRLGRRLLRGKGDAPARRHRPRRTGVRFWAAPQMRRATTRRPSTRRARRAASGRRPRPARSARRACCCPGTPPRRERSPSRA
ncbi:MAG: hypothetical protein QOH95_1429, partial [Gaiellaceae bacterium]|nr:hypothetical protein [Gaiellaceae bacterium]